MTNMRVFRIALAQVNTIVGDLEGNVDKILNCLAEARSVKADLVAFPELAIPGYPPEDLLLRPSFIQRNIQSMKQVVAESTDIAVVVGFVDSDGNNRNAAAVGYNGKLSGVYHKMCLPNYGVFDEERYFKSGDLCPVFIINGVTVGVNICEDIWYADGPVSVQREAGAKVIININGSPYHLGKRIDREKMGSTRASNNKLYIAYLNMVGGQDELVFDGGSIVCDPNGNIIAKGKQFEEDLVVVDLELESDLSGHMEITVPPKDDYATFTNTEKRTLTYSSPGTAKRFPPLSKRNVTDLDPEEEVFQALVVGTRDYVRKNGFTKVVIGLSGGVDSALTACIAADALNKENVLVVMIPSRFTSETSIVDAEQLANNLGTELWTVPLEKAHSAFLDILASHFKGTEPNIAEENIQARIRGNILMAISNKFGWLVLTTGNKSELATGYATLYGDMAGGFAVIKDVPKTMVYKLSTWRNGVGPTSVIPENILTKAPTAELKPNQKDEDSLPPYEVLDPILQEYIEHDKSYQELIDMVDNPDLVKKIITMVDNNEYKRRQAPPGIKITPKAFGKDRRLPIVNRFRHF